MTGTAINPLDPALDIPWPVPIDVEDAAQLSVKDRGQPNLSEIAR